MDIRRIFFCFSGTSFVIVFLALTFVLKKSNNVGIKKRIDVLAYNSYHRWDKKSEFREVAKPLETVDIKVCGKRVPNVVVQIGPPRTASTLQFQILCLMMAMSHIDKPQTVSCQFITKPRTKYGVIKTHAPSVLKYLPKDAWIFMTAKSKDSLKYKILKQVLERENRTRICDTVDAEMVTRNGYRIAYRYQPMFGISDEQMSHIMTYLRSWEILRRCCGAQMSSDWRNRLSPIRTYTPHYNEDNVTYPACEMYDIGQTERFFINTYIYKRFVPIYTLKDTIGKPSTIDGVLNGHYCERCNENIKRRRSRKINKICA